MKKAWYARRGDREVGPIAQSTLEKWASVGRLRPSDHVRWQNETDWRPAQEAVQFKKQQTIADNSQPDARHSPSDVASSATPFGTWYKERWLSKLRWYFQTPLWLIYGFVWIPIWYVATATPSGGINRRWASLSLTGKAVACLPLLLLAMLIAVPDFATSYVAESKRSKENAAYHKDVGNPSLPSLESASKITTRTNSSTKSGNWIVPQLDSTLAEMGPNGEALHVYDGKYGGGWYQYYVSAAGDKVKHGKLRSAKGEWDAGQDKVEADYYDGKLLRQIRWNRTGEVVETISRQQDGTCLVEKIGPIWKNVRCRFRTSEIIEPTTRRRIKELDAVLSIDGKETIRSVPYVNGFMEGVKDAGGPERRFVNAKRSGATALVEELRHIAKDVVSEYRFDANEQLKVGNRGLYHPELLVGRADGAEYGYRVLGILP